MQSTHPLPKNAGAGSPSTAEPIPTSLLPSTSTKLLDKYVLPKVALTIITLSSLAGVWLTMGTHGAATLPATAVRWLHLIALGVMAGGYMWKGFLAQAADAGRKPARAAEVRHFAAAQFLRFRHVTRVALALYAVTGLLDLVQFSRMGVPCWC